ncbi:MAG: LysM peptidoglycan-binding domain-containing protein [Anaerolineaceae bacterium]|nr:LysM peptidoglycan-binding domain-containing protein [Anaerolineaceae bacterium]
MNTQIFGKLLIGLIAVSATGILVLGALSLALAPGVVLKTATPTAPSTVTPAEPVESATFTPAEATRTITPTPCLPPAGWLPVVVQPGDTLKSLALERAVSRQMIREENCLPDNNLLSDSTIYLPPLLPTATRSLTPTPVPVVCGPPSGWIRYIVQPGDNLFRLSLAYGVSVQQLQFANCLGNSTLIFAGQALYVPNVRTRTPVTTATRTPTRTVPTPTVPAHTPTAPVVTPEPPTAVPGEDSTPEGGSGG